MIKSYISVEIVDHRLAGMPHVLRVTGKPSARRPASRAIAPLRGIAIAAALSVMLWAGLIAAVAGTLDGKADGPGGVDTAACAGAPCETPTRG